MPVSPWSSSSAASVALARGRGAIGRGDHAEALALHEEAAGHLRAALDDLRRKVAAVDLAAGPVTGTAVGDDGPPSSYVVTDLDGGLLD